MTTFASQKSYPQERTLSRLRRLERKQRIAAGKRPKNCVTAYNEVEAGITQPGERFGRFHPTKGHRTEFVGFGMQGALAEIVSAFYPQPHMRKAPKVYATYNRAREKARNLRNMEEAKFRQEFRASLLAHIRAGGVAVVDHAA